MLENRQNWAISSRAPQECGEGSTTRARSPERTVKPHERAASSFPCKRCGGLERYSDGKCKACKVRLSKAYYESNKSEVLQRHKVYGQVYAEKKRKIASDWAKSNRARRAEIWAAYYTAKKQAMPAWADREAISSVYAQAREISIATGIKHQVDHIIPLQGELVCGLHVHWNLQILDARENAAKGNRVMEDEIV